MEPRSSQPYVENYPDIPARQGFEHAQTCVGVIGSEYPLGHVVRLGGMLAPLVIGEIVKDPDKKWRWIRIISLLSAGVSELLWAQRERERRESRKAHHCR
jgi:hypothetical protein